MAQKQKEVEETDFDKAITAFKDKAGHLKTLEQAIPLTTSETSSIYRWEVDYMVKLIGLFQEKWSGFFKEYHLLNERVKAESPFAHLRENTEKV